MKARVMKHNPAFLTREELVRSFVVRQVDLELILEKLREGGEGPNQHILLIGPRGIGKTTLVLRVAAAVEAELELNKKWYPLVFSEESYEVATAAEFWLEAILHLADQTGDARLQAAYDELKKQRDERRLYEQALARLMDFADAQGKRLLVIVENMNMILGEQLSADDGWVLRHTLQNEHRIMMLGTATTRFDEIDNIKKAMFDLFWTHDLRPLDTEECRAVWASVTGSEISARRVRPIQILTGGSPRLLTILAAFAADISLRELMSKLTQLVDEHTTYFKSNLESLPAVERKVYVALADIWSPATAREVADAARIDVNKASALLHRLVQRGAVVEAKKRGRKVSYQIAERMYNIYHLMRRRGGEVSRVRAVVDFMVHMYDEAGLVDVTRAITDEACQVDSEARKDHYAAFLSILSRTASPEARAKLWTSINPKFFQLDDAPADVKDLLRDKRHVWVRETRAKYGTASSVNGDSRDTWDINRWRLALQDGEETIDEMEMVKRRAVELDPKSPRAWIRLGFSLYMSKQLKEAESAVRKAIALDQSSSPYRHYLALGDVLATAGRYSEASEAFEQYLKHYPPTSEMASRLGDCRFGEQEYSEAEKAYRKAFGIDPANDDAWNGCGAALGALGQHEEAMKVLRRAILGNAMLEQSKYKEAEEVLLKGVDVYKGTRGEHSIRCMLAMALLVNGSWQEALDEARRAMADEDLVRKMSPLFTEIFSLVAASGHAAEAMDVLKSSPANRALEPLLVALQIMAGEDPNAPQEVIEVANDIVENVENIRRQVQAARPKEKSKPSSAPKRTKAASSASRRAR
jgi:tetratricopeptide (TPR) repeat protein